MIVSNSFAVGTSTVIGMLSGIFTVSSLVVNDLASSNSVIIPQAILVTFLAGTVFLNKCINDLCNKNNLGEEEEYSDVESEDGVSSCDDGGRRDS